VRRGSLGDFVEIQVEVNGTISMRDGHGIGHRVNDALLASELAVIDVVAHVVPSLADQSRTGERQNPSSAYFWESSLSLLSDQPQLQPVIPIRRAGGLIYI